MTEPVPGPEIVNACRVLFPAGIVIDSGFLYAIADEDIKTAFRKKALKTHPDRAQALGRSQEELSRLFRDVTSAYDVLKAFLSQRSSYDFGHDFEYDSGDYRQDQAGPDFGDTCARGATGGASGWEKKHQAGSFRPSGNSRFNNHRHARPRSSSAGFGRYVPDDYYYQGAMPRRELRLGEFLYYSGMISWRTLIAAIVWQKRQRPLFGEIARQWNYLSDDDIRLILSGKTWKEMFGEYARRHGFLSRFQQMAVTGRQRRLQPLFGTHFVDNRLFTTAYIEQLVRRKEWYNSRLRG